MLALAKVQETLVGGSNRLFAPRQDEALRLQSRTYQPIYFGAPASMTRNNDPKCPPMKSENTTFVVADSLSSFELPGGLVVQLDSVLADRALDGSAQPLADAGTMV